MCAEVMLMTSIAEGSGQQQAPAPRANVVVLRGRLSMAVEERTLPSGDTILTTRVTVDRDDAVTVRPGRCTSRQRVDAIDCVVWSRRIQRTVRRWQLGDQVYVEGALRRRFYSGAHGTTSRVEVEVTRGRRLATASAPARVRPLPSG